MWQVKATHGWVSKNIFRQISDSCLLPFSFRDAEMLAVTGRNTAVARLGLLSFTAIFAWLIWSTVHLHGLIGFRTHLLTLIYGAWDYVFLTGWYG